jgi:polyisoprenoid-binding protein YceI
MKKQILFLAASVLFAAQSFAQIANGNYLLDFTKSTINWKATKKTGSHEGTVKVSSGIVRVANDGKTLAGKVKVDMNSIACTDIKDAGTNANFLNHLKSEDFFHSVKFPDANFEVTKFDGKKVYGKITIKGITKEVSFDANISGGNNQITIKGTLVLDRTQFDIKYGSSSFFDNLGDKAIDNNFTLTLNLIGNKK